MVVDETVTHFTFDEDDDLDFDEIIVDDDLLESLQDRLNSAPVDTAAALSSFNPKADKFQQAVVTAAGDTIRLVAPAGSGKTQTVVNRLLTKVKDGLAPQRILLLTFDNSAAMALREKLQEQLARLETTLDKLEISTLNAYGFGILRSHFPEEYRQVLDPFRRRATIQKCSEALEQKSPERAEALSGGVNERFMADLFSLLKNNLFDPRDLDAQKLANFLLRLPEAAPLYPDPSDKKAVKQAIQALTWLYKLYERKLIEQELLDFDDQKLRAYVCLSKSPQILKRVQAAKSEIVVDEFQDINLLDFELIKLISAKSTLVVTGDDDQAIYGFRGCSPDYIIDLEKHLGRKVSSYELQINYRSPPNIVRHAGELIKNNSRRIPKSPVAHREDPSDIKTISSVSAVLEAKYLVSVVSRLKCLSPTLEYSDFAVLYRTNAQSLPIQLEFIMNNIPYYVRRQDNLLESDTLHRLLACLSLKLAIESGQEPKVADMVGTVKAYFRWISDKVAQQLTHYFRANRDFVDAISSEGFWKVLPKARSSHLATGVTALLAAPDLGESLNVLVDKFKGLKGIAGSLEDALDQKVPLGEVYDLAASFKGSIGEFVTEINSALELARKTGAGKNEESGVSLLTYFKSKGRQWHTVMLTSCNEGLIPHKRARVEDERRLFYVALTRASSNLIISYVKKSCNNPVAPSRFLEEAHLL